MIAIGNDHAAVAMKQQIAAWLTEHGYQVKDFGIGPDEKCDYPDMAKQVGMAVASKECEMGILICGTGVGMSIAANKIDGVRAAAVSDSFSCKYCRLHNNANILCLGERVIGVGLALQLTELFVTTEFESGGRHQTRVEKIGQIEVMRNQGTL